MTNEKNINKAELKLEQMNEVAGGAPMKAKVAWNRRWLRKRNFKKP